MKKFNIVIEETLERVVKEEAKTLQDAIDNVEDKYNKNEIVLSYEDFVEKTIRKKGEFSRKNIFYTNYGKSILIEGTKAWALIKIMDIDEYVVTKNITYNSQNNIFEWEKEEKFKDIFDAIKYFKRHQTNKIKNMYKKKKRNLPNSVKIQLFEIMVDEIFELNNYSEAINKLKEYGLTNEELCCITSMSESELLNILDNE